MNRLKWPVPCGGHPGDALAVRRQARLDVDRAGVRQCVRATAGQVEPPQFHRLAVVAREHDAAAIARDVGLVVVGAGGMRELDRLVIADALAPQRAAHAVDERRAVGQEAHRRRAGGQLRQVQLAPVVAVRQVDLLEHRLAARGSPATATHADTSATPHATPRMRLPATRIRLRPRARPALRAGWCAAARSLRRSPRVVDVERRHEAHRARAARQQQQAVVEGARDHRIAQRARRRARGIGFDQFHADHQALAAHLADARELALPASRSSRHEVRADGGGVAGHAALRPGRSSRWRPRSVIGLPP